MADSADVDTMACRDMLISRLPACWLAAVAVAVSASPRALREAKTTLPRSGESRDEGKLLLRTDVLSCD